VLWRMLQAQEVVDTGSRPNLNVSACDLSVGRAELSSVVCARVLGVVVVVCVG
jgi:hypothetical protein